MRQKPEVETDVFWLDWCRSDGGWLQDCVLRPAEPLEELMAVFRGAFAGFVVQDPEVPAMGRTLEPIGHRVRA